MAAGVVRALQDRCARRGKTARCGGLGRSLTTFARKMEEKGEIIKQITL